MASIYCGPMSTEPAVLPSRLDAPALARWQRRRLSLPQSPWLHQEAARRMAPRLAILREPPRTVLDASQDAGPLDEALRTACPGADFTRLGADSVSDESTRPAWWRRLGAGWLGGEPRHLHAAQLASAQVDMLWANMRLHLEADPLPLLRAWRAALAPTGFVMFSTVGPGSLRQLRELYARQGWGPAHLPFVDMHDLGDMLVATGFADPVMDQEVLTLTYASPQALLAELREWGCNVAPGRHPACRSRAWRDRLYQGLAAGATDQGRVSIDVELVYGHAFRAPDRGPAVAEQTAIGLDDMKLMLARAKGRK
jgi:malonyl-CoA O-methyltransferase